MSLMSDQLWQQRGVANTICPARTPGLSSGGDRIGDSPDRNGRPAHRVGIHTRSHKGVESDRAGELHLPVRKDNHRAYKHSQRVHDAIRRKQMNKTGETRTTGGF